ncbi:DUF5691 domain-containing protein [Streptomyces sp. SID13031]|uniref:DUF5691 domain-containing protein n=1 Tax=Streptomyces sp. SID13031 TaxID=2706046 RepID=UPI0013CCAB08|nr:DUF5691 domain-containing protein [Streptomyces sp. SID13031]NEA34881.1 hypothetical protein [Streptomyces sp. SID13031]
MRGWDGLVSSALLGTERRPPRFEELPPKIQEQLGEGGLLDAAALATLYKRAGRTPLEGLAPLPAAQGEDQPLPRPAAIRRLTAMLSGFQTTALGEWLRAADAKGWGVPPEQLPALADYARGRAEYRPLVVKAAGRRASWLADLNPDWRFLHEAVVEGNEHWTHGNPTQRRSWLRARRQSDPTKALEALEEVWPSEPAAVRLDFLGLLADGLPAGLGDAAPSADEVFLERALDDRSKEVRRAAAALLQRIPGSQYGERMAQRVWSQLTVSQGVLVVELPTGVTTAMERDGVDSQPKEGIGKRAWWFQQLLAAAPLATSELDYLQLKVEGCSPEVLQVAWAQAAIREQEADWARALLLSNARTGGRVAELLRILPPDEWVPAIELLRVRVDIADLVGGLPVPWPATLGTAVLDQLAKSGSDRRHARLASIAARAVPAEVLDHPITREPTGEEDTWRRRLVETLIFRREMYEELS